MMAVYQPASFNGAAFFVVETTDTFGRRGVHHEFPYRDRGLWDDLGGKDGQREIDGYLTTWSPGGLPAARAALIAALQRGEGELVHPWLGRQKVVCTDYEVKHSATELGVCRISMTFIDADAGGGGGVASDPVSGLLSSVQGALGAAAGLFAGAWSLQGIQNFVASISLSGLAPIFEVQGQAASIAGQGGALLDFFMDAGRRLVRGRDLGGDSPTDILRGLVADADILDPRDIARQSIGLALMAAAKGTIDLEALWAGAMSVNDPALPLPAATAVSTGRIRRNLAAARFLGLSISGFLSAALLTTRSFADYDQAAEARVVTLERFDNLAEAASDLGEAQDDARLFERAMTTARAQALSLVAARFPTSGRRAKREFLESFPSVVLTYELFESLDDEPALVSGNSARHPGFMPRSVEFVSHA